MTNAEHYTGEPNDSEPSIADAQYRAYLQGKLARDHRGWYVFPDSPDAVDFADKNDNS